MNFNLSEEQEMLKKMARDFLDREAPKAYVRAMEEDARGFTPETWEKIAGLGDRAGEGDRPSLLILHGNPRSKLWVF